MASFVAQALFFLVLGGVVGFLIGRYRHGHGGAGAPDGAAAREAAAAAEWRARAEAAERERERVGAELAEAGRRIAALEAERGPAREAPPAAIEAAREGYGTAALPEPPEAAGERPAVAAEPAPDGADAAGGVPPPRLDAPEGAPDDLRRISGIGPGMERMLHSLGIYHFRQIAAFTPENVAWLDERLRFRGRIEREKWVEQARRLAEGGGGSSPPRAGGP